jgi:alpha 1,2-mannosyltransferase
MVGFGSPRHRRLFVFFCSIITVSYLTLVAFPTKHTEKLQDITEELTEHISETFSEFLEQYFTNDDNNSEVDDAEAHDVIKGPTETKDPKQEVNREAQQFYEPILKMMYSKREEFPKLELNRLASDDKGSFWSKKKLQEYLTLNESLIPRWREIHDETVLLIPSQFPKGLYNGTGIVIIGGGPFSWLSLISIKSLRSFGCKLPIEMIIPTLEEYEESLCEDILPPLGGKCVLLHNVLGSSIMEEIPFKGYQYKSLALLATSFENVLFLDSDNVLVSNPEPFFEMEAYKTTGMVTWPDYWERTTSPYLYDILGVEIDEQSKVRDGKWPLKAPEPVTDPEKVRYHDLKGTFPDMSTESGQIMIRKSDHVKTLFLSLFYNLYGPDFFYKLISQGFDGEGDKDTFVIGAIIGNESFYQVHSEIQTFGWFDGDQFNGVSMGQRDPLEDYEQFKELSLKEVPDYSSLFETRKARVFTIHANYPKLNPYLLYKEEKLKNSKGEDFRMYSDISRFLPDQFDFELVQYKRMKFMLCELKISLKYFDDVISREELCGFVEGHLQYLHEHPINSYSS